MSKLSLNLDAIAKARETTGLLYLELYCDKSACPAREIHLRVKDHDKAFVETVRRRGLCCPICGAPAKMHWIRTDAAQDSADRLEARSSVNMQMYVRDYCEDGFPVLPGDVIGDDRLPPTPDGWFGAKHLRRLTRRFIREGDE